MKNQLMNFVYIVLISTLLTGCFATHMGTMTGSASLSSPNFSYKKQNIVGESQATYVIGIGGEARQSLILEAKKNMLKENPLLKNQALANVTVSYKTTNFIGFLIVVVRCTVSADIVEFGPVQTDITQTEVQKPVAVQKVDKDAEITTVLPLKVGDKVSIVNYFNRPVEGKVTAIQDGDITVEYTNRNNKTKQVKVLGYQVEKIK